MGFLSPVEGAEDLVFLKNGDRVSGHIHTMEDDQLEIATSFAGTIKIGWKEIQRILSVESLSLTFHEGTQIPQGIGARDGDRLIIHELSVDGPISFADIKTIGISNLYQRGNIALGGNNASGNSNTHALNLSVGYTLRNERHRLITSGQFTRGEANGQLSAENGSGTARYDYLLTRQVFLSGQQLWEADRFQNLTTRSTTNIAVGYDFYDYLTRSLSIGAGPGLVYEKFTTDSATLSPAIGWFADWRQDVLDGRATLFHNHHGAQDLILRNSTRIEARQGIRVKVYGAISLNLEYDLRFNSTPTPGKHTVDSALIFGVSYGFERMSPRSISVDRDSNRP
ncbi:MAG TPA: DUF481 domain-containing protein [Nitrospira sp.]|nr:DUF481 domain-containing protein [Nitrospira sp.]